MECQYQFKWERWNCPHTSTPFDQSDGKLKLWNCPHTSTPFDQSNGKLKLYY